MEFQINCLEITCPEILDHSIQCSDSKKKQIKTIYKKLTDRFYLFNDYYFFKDGKIEKNPNRNNLNSFFNEDGKINIQAIVGKNGSCKSSLIDLLLIVANNFSFMYIQGIDNDIGNESIYYVKDVYVNVYYSFFDEKGDARKENELKLCCKGEKISLKNLSTGEIIFENEIDVTSNTVKNSTTKTTCYNTASSFFYNVVSNYSLQSYISKNYSVEAYKISDGVICDNINSSWIDPVFHKNDGYLRPIVINPFRSNGNINTMNEINLSKDRLAAVLFFVWEKNKSEKKKDEYFDYSYDSIEIKYNERFILDKINDTYHGMYGFEDFEELEELYSKMENIFDEESVLRKQISKYANIPNPLNDIQKNALVYLAFKLLWITEKYHSYSNRRNSIIFDLKEKELKIDVNLFNEYLEEILDDHSHITKKIFRTIKYLSVSPGFTKKTFSFYEYVSKLREGRIWTLDILSEIDESLPPSIFDYELFLIKNGEAVNYKNLSAGEMQLLQTMSVHLYHMSNLISVSQRTTEILSQYRFINLIFDEVEICFHPEYQRKFISTLIHLIKMIDVLNTCSVNIFILTHSPFILSDIPRGRVLYLKEGVSDIKRAEKSNFAGNIGDMLFDSFFMDSSIGEFAEEKLRELVIYLRRKYKTNINFNMYLENIADPVTKSLIKEIAFKDETD